MDEVMFKDFQKLMLKRKRTVDDLVDIFRGKIEEPREFFERVMSCRYHGEDRSGVVIPCRSVIEFYLKEQAYFQDSEQDAARQAVKRKHKPMSEERRQALIKQLEKVRAAKVRAESKVGVGICENIEEISRGWRDGYLPINQQIERLKMALRDNGAAFVGPVTEARLAGRTAEHRTYRRWELRWSTGSQAAERRTEGAPENYREQLYSGTDGKLTGCDDEVPDRQ